MIAVIPKIQCKLQKFMFLLKKIPERRRSDTIHTYVCRGQMFAYEYIAAFSKRSFNVAAINKSNVTFDLSIIKI